MNLDIRYPLGMIFLAIGAILTIFGAMTRGSAMYAISMGININLIWGILMLAFGGLMIFMAKRAS
jgi:hypothetical protein